MQNTFKLKIPLKYRRFFMIQHFFGSGLVLLDGFGDALCLITNSAWKRIVRQISDRWIKDGVSSEKWIKSRLSEFYQSKIETQIDIWGNVLIPSHFKEFHNDKVNFEPNREMLMISPKSLKDTFDSAGDLLNPKDNMPANKFIITMYILDLLKEYATNKT